MLEPDPELDPGLCSKNAVREASQRNAQVRSRNANDTEGYEFYDISAWALPVAFGVEAYWTEDAPTAQRHACSRSTNGP